MLTNKGPFINWKVVFISVIFIIVLASTVYFVQSYRGILASKLPNEDEVTAVFLEESALEEIDEVMDFHESNKVFIATGTNSKGEELIVFLQEKTDDEKQYIKEYKQDELQEEKDIVSSWKEECNECTLKRTTFAMIDKEPLLEITFEDEYKRYAFAYYSLEDGQLYEQMKFNRKYQ